MNVTSMDKRRPASTYEAAWLPTGLRFIDTLRVGEMSGRLGEVDTTTRDLHSSLRLATMSEIAASQFVIRVAVAERQPRDMS